MQIQLQLDILANETNQQNIKCVERPKQHYQLT